MNACIIPGSFDPMTWGHLDIIQRAHVLFDRVIVALLSNPFKTPMFTIQQRMDFARKATEALKRVEVDSFNGLLVDYAKQKDAFVIIKGLRAVSDFEYEMQMALMNRSLEPRLETLFLMTDTRFSYLSSSMVREVGRLGGDISSWIPESIYPAVKDGFFQR